MCAEKENLVSKLKEINCCKICILRYLNEKCVISYKNPSKYIENLLGINSGTVEEVASKLKKPNPCTACLGLLEESHLEHQVGMIVEKVNSASYDADHVAIALSLPVSLLIRNHSIWLHISDTFRNYYLNKQIYSDIDGAFGDLKSDIHTLSIKEAWKMLAAPILTDRLNKSVNSGTDAPFIVNVHYDYSANDEEASCMVEMHPETFGGREFQRRKYHNEIFTRKSVEIALGNTSRDLFETYTSIPPPIPTDFISCKAITCSHESLYLAGRYNKYSRSLSQTPWLINGERRMESSVEEIINGPVSRLIAHDVIKFASSGREDVDVRTLGRGRPFVLDIQNPRTTKLSFAQLRQLENEINESSKSVFVRDLQIAPKKDLVHIKMGETSKTKTYHCYCMVKGQNDSKEIEKISEELKRKLAELTNTDTFVIKQKTPVRVLHRRPLATRPRTIYWMKAKFSHTDGFHWFFKLMLKVEAGTYIKELIHGDLGRTKPNISLMLKMDADILALDVEEVDLSWPPSVLEPSLKNDKVM